MAGEKDEFECSSDLYKTLLESTKAIPWRVDWVSRKFTYIGPQVEEILGWNVEDWQTIEDWADRIHPQERMLVVGSCMRLIDAGEDHGMDYRALTKDGEYIWIHDVIHVIRNEAGDVEALVGFMFDITERKVTEQKLLDLQKELEALSYKDSLTNIANRRMFDSVLDMEWTMAQRMKQPISVLLIDIDYFKQYNDCYGHIQGDECLKKVARALSSAKMRIKDFIARFGGEEFVMILPETDLESARKVAERCQKAIFKLQIPHQNSSVGQLLTVSIGLGSIIPTQHLHVTEFIDQVDQQLYRAKQYGRNQVQVI